MICIFNAIHYCLQMCLKILEISVLKYIDLILLIFFQHQDQYGKLAKKTGVKLELLTDINMLLMVEEGIRDAICHAIHRCAKANNKYMNNYDKKH